MTVIARPTNLDIAENAPLAPLTTMGVGGAARYLVTAHSSDEAVLALDWAKSQKLPTFLLGGGSNVVFSDDGFPGVVIRLAIRGLRTDSDGEYDTIQVGASHGWDDFVNWSIDHGLAGIECLSGIPGLVGAVPVQNVGAYGQEVAETITRVRVIDTRNGRRSTFLGVQCSFGYRTSRFKTLDAGRFIITSVTFRLRREGAPTIRYADLERELSARGFDKPTLQNVRDTVIAVRRRKGMVVDPADADSRGCGSFFVNPVMSSDDFAAALENAMSAGLVKPDDHVPVHDASPGKVKISAAWLIERSGLTRGYRHGRVGLSKKHVLAIVNLGGATAAEIADLMRVVQLRVRECFGIDLTPEPVFAGFPDES